MAIEWSDNITVAKLADEPTLSDELAILIDQIRSVGGASPRTKVEAAEPAPAAPKDSRSPKAVPHVVLDFAQVSYINSSNIAQLLRLSKGLTQHNRSMRLCSVSDEVWSVMLVTGLDKVFRFAPDTLTALASLQIEDEQAAESE